jgi:hypothetical protein
MDLNQLYLDHQLLLIKAERAGSRVTRNECEVDASNVAARIGCLQRGLGAAAAPFWEGRAGLGAPSPAASLENQRGHAS